MKEINIVNTTYFKGCAIILTKEMLILETTIDFLVYDGYFTTRVGDLLEFLEETNNILK